ncbi:MAG: ornithine cyclodeaminase family protein [Pseudomonadota bacterium]
MGGSPPLKIFDANAVRHGLSVAGLIPVMRETMIELSSGRVRQNLRSFIGLGEGRTFAIMPAAFGGQGVFGAKLVSVFADGTGRKAHEGVVVLFDGETGAPFCVADAGEITALRTPAASAAATEALARADADVLAVIGLGRQAAGHIEAIAAVRQLREIRVWGRDLLGATAFAEAMSARTGAPVSAVGSVADAVRGAGIVCMATTATEPLLAAVDPGAHINLVGSSGPMAAEIEGGLVARARFIADHRAHVLVHGGEFLRAKAAGLVGDDHVVAEIGEVFAGAAPGRTSADEITIYKSLGHAVQDLAATEMLYRSSV